MPKARGVYQQVNTAGDVRWYVRIMVDGVYQRFAPRGGFLTKKEAELFAFHAKADITRGKFFPDKYKKDLAMPLKQLLTEHADQLATGPNTKNNQTYQHWWITHFGRLDAALLTPRHLDQAEQRLLAAGKSKQTIHHYLKFLRHRLAVALRDGLIEQTPFHARRLAPVHNLRTRFYSQAERHKLYAALSEKWREAAELAGLTGLRWSEQFHLTRSQVHLREGFLELRTTKAGRPQARLLNQRARQIIAQQLARHRSTWLYPNDTNTGPVNLRNFHRRIWQPACEAAGVTNARWNDWRHTFASDLTMAGHSDRTVAALLGHTSTQMVRRYAHLADAHLRQAVESVSRLCPSSADRKQRKSHKSLI